MMPDALRIEMDETLNNDRFEYSWRVILYDNSALKYIYSFYFTLVVNSSRVICLWLLYFPILCDIAAMMPYETHKNINVIDKNTAET